LPKSRVAKANIGYALGERKISTTQAVIGGVMALCANNRYPAGMAGLFDMVSSSRSPVSALGLKFAPATDVTPAALSSPAPRAGIWAMAQFGSFDVYGEQLILTEGRCSRRCLPERLSI
jgi:hypothetical protein